MKVQFEIKNSDLKKMLALNELLFGGDSEVAGSIEACMNIEEPVEIDVEDMDYEAASKFQSMMMLLALRAIRKNAENAKNAADEQGVS